MRRKKYDLYNKVPTALCDGKRYDQYDQFPTVLCNENLYDKSSNIGKGPLYLFDSSAISDQPNYESYESFE